MSCLGGGRSPFNLKGIMAITPPIAPENNPPITPQYYQPNRFIISSITNGQTTIVTTSVNHNYVVGQEVRLIIPSTYGARQLNETKGLVLSIPAPNQVVLNINSSNADSFISTNVQTVITGASNAVFCVLTTNNNFSVGQYVLISGVSGMTQLNGNNYLITAQSPTTLTINVNSSGFGAYTSGGNCYLVGANLTQSQILAVGDINSGQINTGRTGNITYIPGSFINISPL